MNGVACAHCGTPNPATAKFCNECAASFVDRAAALETPAARAPGPALPHRFAEVWGFIWEGHAGVPSALLTIFLSLLIFAVAAGGYYSSTRLHTYEGHIYTVRWAEPNR